MKPMTLSVRSLLLMVAMVFGLALASGCATTKPVSAEDYLQSAYAQVGGVYQTIGDLKAQKSITQAQAKSAIAQVEEVEVQIDTAQALMKGGDIASAQGALKLALAALVQIQARLPKPAK